MCVGEHSSYPKVTKFELFVLSHEDILCLEISVDYLPIMDMLYCEAKLAKPVKDLGFAKILAISMLDYV